MMPLLLGFGIIMVSFLPHYYDVRKSSLSTLQHKKSSTHDLLGSFVFFLGTNHAYVLEYPSLCVMLMVAGFTVSIT